MENIELIVAIVFPIYELIVSLIPTAKSWSILTIAMKLLRRVAPDKSSMGGNHEIK